MSLLAALEPDVAQRLLAGRLPVHPLTPEAGARRYFRPLDPAGAGWLLVRSPDPPPRPTTDWLTGLAVPVPRLGPSVPGAYLVEDLGDRHLAHDPSSEAYEAVLAAGERLGRARLPDGHPNARLALDEDLFLRELRQFREDYLQGFRRRAHSPAAADAVDAACATLAREAAGGPWRTQHRDFHSRNVLLPPGRGPVILDHQDLRPGPLFYDLASLRTDAYTDLPGGISDRLAEEVTALGSRAGLAPEEARRRYHATAVQRVLKALGTFGRLLARGRAGYSRPERRARRLAARLLQESGAFAIFREWLA